MKHTLKRPIQNAAGDGEITEVKMKEEKDIDASDFFGMTFSSDGTSNLGAMADTIANLCGLTSDQVASLHPKDYIFLSGEAGKLLG